MAHILRLRGHQQFHDPRGWGLFRLAHHRLARSPPPPSYVSLANLCPQQKEKLAKHLAPLPESQDWLDSLDGNMSFVQLEKGALDISKVCDNAQQVLRKLTSSTSPWEEVMQLVCEMHSIDQANCQWRQRPEWSFKTLSREEISTEPSATCHLPERVEIHRDLWMAYEWNYHRTSRIILHQQLIECLYQASTGSAELPTSFSEDEVTTWAEASMSTIRVLIDEVLSTVPQSLGDVDCLGQYIGGRSDAPRCQAIGAYLILWPIRVIKGPTSRATEPQRLRADDVFERIRECTGMKSHLGTLSSI